MAAVSTLAAGAAAAHALAAPRAHPAADDDSGGDGGDAEAYVAPHLDVHSVVRALPVVVQRPTAAPNVPPPRGA